MVRKSQELRPVMTRLPEGLRRRLEREAEENGRSMNAEIIYRLQQSFRHAEHQVDLIEQAKLAAEAAATATVDKLRVVGFGLPHSRPEEKSKSDRDQS
jgi:phosphoenolpyruvate carboxylase